MSFGSPSPNDLIDKSLVSIPLDSLKIFAPYLVNSSVNSNPIILWKSDVEGAYRLLPMSPQWQICQVVHILNFFHVDRCSNFGSSGSARLWCSFFSLILWIASDTSKINDLFTYMDDSWGSAPASDTVSFRDRQIPLNQAKLPDLFVFLGVPWSWDKQIWGPEIEMIGHVVSASNLSFTLPSSKKVDLVASILDFHSQPSQPLVAWSPLLGLCSWALNTFPLGRFAWQSGWSKTSGKTIRNTHIPISLEIQTDLRWFAETLNAWPGRFLLNFFFGMSPIQISVFLSMPALLASLFGLHP